MNLIKEWFCVNLGDAIISHSKLTAHQNHLTQVYEAYDKPSNMLAVYSYESQELHCQITLFLTAEFQQAAMLEGAARCREPDLRNTSYLAGNAP
ncbi:hypothetical protein [Shewanella sp. AS1]|uniref:hypothetical protein n=1 Tax=Shewanella sp. AS1 TaxID=2907626 RepID=UPI001F39EE1E|nr:hypothetical protein [Shewanella sp. AS1]